MIRRNWFPLAVTAAILWFGPSASGPRREAGEQGAAVVPLRMVKVVPAAMANGEAQADQDAGVGALLLGPLESPAASSAHGGAASVVADL